MKKIRSISRYKVLIVDVLISTLAFIIAFGLERYFASGNFFLQETLYAIAITFFFNLIGFYLFKTYAGVLQFTGTHDVKKIFFAATLIALLNGFTFWMYFLYSGKLIIKPETILLHYMALLIGMAAFRVIVRSMAENNSNAKGAKRTNALIIGVDDVSVLSKKSLDQQSNNLNVVAFIDITGEKVGQTINGVTIYANKELNEVIERLDIEALFFSPNVKPLLQNAFIEKCAHYSLMIRNIPPVDTWVNGQFSTKQLKEVSIEELLGRNEIQIDTQSIAKQLKGKIILVTGAAGSIGSEIAKQTIGYQPQELILLDSSETALYNLELQLNKIKGEIKVNYLLCDIRFQSKIEAVLAQFPIDIIYHAAAYKHVPMLEKNPMEAVHTNVLGTKLLAELALKYKVNKFVLISTDKAVNPTNVMGASKRIAEIFIQSLNENQKKNKQNSTTFVTTRFGNVLGSNGSVIPLFKKQIREGGPLTVTHPEITRYFMTIPEACSLVLEAGSMGKGGEIFLFDMGKAVKINDLAKKMIVLSGLRIGVDIQIVFTGLRQGEKLYEELLANAENTLPTHNKQIMIAKVRSSNFDIVLQHLNEIEVLFKNRDINGLIQKMKSIVPEYISNNSPFEDFDKVKKIAG